MHYYKKTTLFSAYFLSLILFALPIAHAEPKDREMPINTWLVLGLYENTRANDGMETEWIKEASVTPAPGMKSGEKVWNYFDDRLFSRNYDNYQDLYSYFKIKRQQAVTAKIAYAHTYFYVEKVQEVMLKLGADSEIKAFLNGVPLDLKKNNNSIRDGQGAVLKLDAGWNRLLIKVGNRGEGRFGFYARLAGIGAAGLVVSTEGDGKVELGVASRGMDDVGMGKNALPIAWREWPYVEANAWTHLAPDTQTYDICGGFIDANLVPEAAAFQLQGKGGKPPYRWHLVKGQLPLGLSLSESGKITGTVQAANELRDYPLTVKLVDSIGKEVMADLSLKVKERPNRFYEQAGLVGLVHRPELIPNKSHAELVRSMKRMGYQVMMPITWYNGDPNYSAYWRRETKEAVSDYITPLKVEADRQGVGFGIYMGNFKAVPGYENGTRVLTLLEEVLEKFHPQVIWFDHAGLNDDALDAVYSLVKTINPEITIVKNGVPTLSNGDWDSLCLESIGFFGKGIWNSIPVTIPWFKKFPLETWRHYAMPEWIITKNSKPEDNNPVEYLKLIISIIGTGNVANFDHSLTYQTTEHGSDGKPIPFTSLSEAPFWKCQEAMANWASPEKIPSLAESYTKVGVAPLAPLEWGYLMTNNTRDTLYVHLIKNPWGKTGFPADKKVSLNLPGIKVTQVRWMNQDKEVPFQQDKDQISLSLTNITEDPVSTILKMKLDKPLASSPLSVSHKDIMSCFAAPATAPKSGNLAFQKPSLLLDATGKLRRGPSANRFAFQGNDGLLNTSTAAGESWAWIYEVDLGSLNTISQIMVHFALDGYPTEYRILLSSDRGEWKEVATAKIKEGGRYEHTFESRPGRYIRIQSLKPDGPNQEGGQMQIAELEVLGSSAK
jgi:hypothetical protein